MDLVSGNIPTQLTPVLLVNDSGGSLVFKKVLLQGEEKQPQPKGNLFYLQAELTKLLSPVALNSRLKYFSF